MMRVLQTILFLRIDNKNLIGVDPYDPDLTEALRIQIFKECMQNRWYFFREVFRVTGPGASIESGGGFQFELNRGNLAYLWAMELNISAYLIMPRQTGKTWAAIADITWVHQFKRGSTVLHFNKNQKDANDNLQRIQDAIRMLPNYMQHSNEENLDAAENVELRIMKNQFEIQSMQRLKQWLPLEMLQRRMLWLVVVQLLRYGMTKLHLYSLTL